MHPPRISIVMPCRNQADFVERAICSVLDQGYPNLEFLIIDGGSTDGSLDIINQYRADLAGVVSEPDTGPAQAINKALARATGQIVGILGADDLYLPRTLRHVAQAMSAPDGPAWLVGQCLRIGDLDQMLGKLEPGDPGELLTFLMHDSGPLPSVATFWSRNFFTQFGPFDEDLQFAYDYDYWCRLLAAGQRPQILNQILAAKREHLASRSALHTVEQGLEHIHAARQNAALLPVAQRYALWRNCDQRARIYALAQAELHGQEARQFIWQQLVRHPWWLANNSIRHAVLHGVRLRQPQLQLQRQAA